MGVCSRYWASNWCVYGCRICFLVVCWIGEMHFLELLLPLRAWRAIDLVRKTVSVPSRASSLVIPDTQTFGRIRSRHCVSMAFTTKVHRNWPAKSPHDCCSTPSAACCSGNRHPSSHPTTTHTKSRAVFHSQNNYEGLFFKYTQTGVQRSLTLMAKLVENIRAR